MSSLNPKVKRNSLIALVLIILIIIGYVISLPKKEDAIKAVVIEDLMDVNANPSHYLFSFYKKDQKIGGPIAVPAKWVAVDKEGKIGLEIFTFDLDKPVYIAEIVESEKYTLNNKNPLIPPVLDSPLIEALPCFESSKKDTIVACPGNYELYIDWTPYSDNPSNESLSRKNLLKYLVDMNIATDTDEYFIPLPLVHQPFKLVSNIDYILKYGSTQVQN